MTPSPSAPILCKPQPWFIFRAIALLLMFSFITVYFIYDGAIGYRKKNGVFYLAKSFEEAVKQFNQKNSDNTLTASEWKKFAAEQSVKFPEDPYVLPQDLKQPMPWPELLHDFETVKKRQQWTLLWQDYSAKHGYNSKPPEEPMEKREINEQWICAWVSGGLALVTAFFLFRTLRRRIVADEEGVISQDGKRVPYSDIKVLDLRKWNNKGLAYATYEGPSGKGRLRLDGMTYGGFKKEEGQPAEELVQRIRSRMVGEVIELVPEEEISEQESEEKTPS